ncbi:MAG: hypothetical protein ACYDAP_13515 [Thermoplasmataceae archaeon]
MPYSAAVAMTDINQAIIWQITVISSPRSRRELPNSKVAGGISMGLNSLRPEGIPSFLVSHPL